MLILVVIVPSIVLITVVQTTLALLGELLRPGLVRVSQSLASDDHFQQSASASPPLRNESGVSVQVGY